MPPNTYITEDLSEETVMLRKKLQQQVNKEMEKGNEAYTKNNKVIVKQEDKRNRDNSVSLLKPSHRGPRKSVLPLKTTKNRCIYMRCRSNTI